MSIVNHVTGEYNRNLRNLETGNDVRQEEVIAVADDSLGELMLRDQTKVALGPGARLTLDRFVYDPNKTAGYARACARLMLAATCGPSLLRQSFAASIRADYYVYALST